ncbi:hypothetical protein OUZ56_012363 [Daphnia magna]|uniref:Reverse transcriptase RNase H-like domain-containing protein n=1 Tax=Daphnia magna TaxID=35525 RepID=A0ABQ9Z2X7_9CRUS|nr:hypothetical protein OUZ56_012363 [Daphnia magna]
MQDGHDYPIPYSSQQLTKAELKFGTTEMEALAGINAIKHFRHYLLDKPFKIISDLRLLVALLGTLYRLELPSKNSKRNELNHQLVLPLSLRHLVLKELHDAPMRGHLAFF